ncbi:MAG: DUF86 domain-containing protein [Clostridiales Family XIII bacterium]|jgi:uncharacterized protein with HEPN domain|nr:DUF86 domain-containing protein [Clostridiales Family XIII bacterium]
MEIRDQRRLAKMREEAQLISSFIANIDCATFMGDIKTKYAVTQVLANIGELERGLSNEIKKQYGTIPWSSIRKTRNVIAHDYEEVDFQRIWGTATTDIPELTKLMHRY